MASSSGSKKRSIKEEVQSEEKHVEKHGILAFLILLALLVVVYSLQTSQVPFQEYSLNGNYVNLSGDNVVLYPGLGSFSAEAWIKTNDPDDGVIVSSGECCGVEKYWSLGKSSTGGAAVLIIKLNDGTGEISESGTKNLADGEWHHVVFVRDAETKKVIGYVDGALDVTFADTTGGISDTSNKLMAGNANPYQEEWFLGSVANIKTYSVAFSSEEVQRMYAGSMNKFQVTK